MPRILIVDDEPAIAVSLRFLMEQEGHAVTVAETGEAALTHARTEAPDLVLLDVMLPGLGGFEVLELLRSEGFAAPVVLLTAKGREADIARGHALGADAYVTKPFAIADVVATVRRLLPPDPP